MRFAEKLKKLMKEKGLSGYRVAKDIKVVESAVRKWYNGKSEPHPKNRKALAEYFDITERELLYSDEPLRIKEAEEELLYNLSNLKLKIIQSLEGLSEAEQREILYNIEDKKLLKEIKAKKYKKVKAIHKEG